MLVSKTDREEGRPYPKVNCSRVEHRVKGIGGRLRHSLFLVCWGPEWWVGWLGPRGLVPPAAIVGLLPPLPITVSHSHRETLSLNRQCWYLELAGELELQIIPSASSNPTA